MNTHIPRWLVLSLYVTRTGWPFMPLRAGMPAPQLCQPMSHPKAANDAHA